MIALVDADLDRLLIVGDGREGARLFDRDRCVALDHRLCEAARDPDPQIEGRHVEQHRVLDLADQRGRVDRGAHRDDLVRIDVGAGLALEIMRHGLADHRQPGRPAHQDHTVEIAHREVGLLERLVADLEGPQDQVLHEHSELGAGELAREPHRLAVLADQHRRDLDQDFVVDRELLLGVLAGELQLLEGVGIVAGIDLVAADEIVGEQVEDAIVEIIAAEKGVAAGREDLEDVLSDLEDRDVEGATAEVVDRDALVQAHAEAIGEGRGGRLVQDAHDFEAGDAARVLGRLALVVVEVGRHGDDGLRDLLARLPLRDLLHLAQHHRRDFGQREFLVADLDPDAVVRGLDDLVGTDRLRLLHFLREVEAADQALGRADGLGRRVDHLRLGRIPDLDGPVLAEVHDGSRRALAEGVREHLQLTVLHHRDTGVAGAQVDADGDLRHVDPSSATMHSRPTSSRGRGPCAHADCCRGRPSTHGGRCFPAAPTAYRSGHPVTESEGASEVRQKQLARWLPDPGLC